MNKIKNLLITQFVIWCLFVIISIQMAQNGMQRFVLFLIFSGITFFVLLFFIKQIMHFNMGRIRRIIAGCIFIIIFLVFNFGGSAVAIHKFKSNRLKHQFTAYREFVNLINDGTIAVPSKIDNITVPCKYKHLGKVAIAAEKNTNGTNVIFVTEPGFMGKFPGYLYVSSGNIKSNSYLDKIIYCRSRIDTNWFDITLFKLIQ